MAQRSKLRPFQFTNQTQVVSRLLLLLVACMTLLVMVTCGKDSPTKSQAPEPTPPPPPPPTPVATRIDISPSSAVLTSVRQTIQLTARVFDQNNAPISSAAVTWASSDTGVATVSGLGLGHSGRQWHCANHCTVGQCVNEYCGNGDADYREHRYRAVLGDADVPG